MAHLGIALFEAKQRTYGEDLYGFGLARQEKPCYDLSDVVTDHIVLTYFCAGSIDVPALRFVRKG
jgi:hypothetical protein